MEAPSIRSENLLPAQGQNLAGSTKTSILERTILKEASIPSPLSSRLLGSIDYDGHPKSLKKTHRQIFRQKDQLLARIRSQDYLTRGKCGLLCWLKFVDGQHGNPPQGLGNVGKIPRLIKYARLREFTQISLSSQSPEATSEVGSASSASNVFAVIRHDSQGGGDYIIETCGQISLSINGVPVGIDTRVRRLPDFAVIEADGIFFFWWRTQKAFDFIPKIVGQKRPFEGSQQYENLSEELPPLKRCKASPGASSTIFSQAFINAGKPSARPTSTESPPPARRNLNRKITPENPPRGFSSKEINLRTNPRPDPISTKRSWLEKLESGLKHYRRVRGPQKENAKESSPIGKLPPDPYDYLGLWDDQVMKSIGVVWDVLRQNDILFAISPLENLQHCWRRSDTGVECKVVLGPNPFIIPLTLWSEASPDFGQLAHHLLAVAKVTDRGPIRIKLMDSSPGTIAKEHIHAVIAGLIMYSGWLGKDGTRPRRVWPAIEFDECVVPEQELVNACGLNVVLNAWAEMLNISINPRRNRVKSCKDGSEEMAESVDFLRQTIEIIDLSISGHMDTETILAFMIYYGYADSGIPLNPEDRDDTNHVPQLELAPLTTKIEDIIDDVKEEVTPTRFDDSYYLDIPNVPNKDDVRFLMKEAGCNEQQAGKALEDANGDMRIARWFVPTTRNNVQKIEKLMREMGCSREEAEGALHEANGNSRMAHFWVQEAWRLQEEEEQRRKRAEEQSEIQYEELKEHHRGPDRSQTSPDFDSSSRYESAVESRVDEETGVDEDEENKGEDEGDEEEDEGDDEDEDQDDDNDNDEEDTDERLQRQEEGELERAKEISLLEFESIRSGLQQVDDDDEVEEEEDPTIHKDATPYLPPGPRPSPRSSPQSPPSVPSQLPSISSIPNTSDRTDFSGNETPKELSSPESSSLIESSQ